MSDDDDDLLCVFSFSVDPIIKLAMDGRRAVEEGEEEEGTFAVIFEAGRVVVGVVYLTMRGRVASWLETMRRDDLCVCNSEERKWAWRVLEDDDSFLDWRKCGGVHSKRE